jgi:transposase
MEPVSCAGCQALQRRLRDLQAENDRRRRQLDEATRAGKRQAAPFAKGPPTAFDCRRLLLEAQTLPIAPSS